jgi:DNA-directed RNA polymerase specialized sigma24 family protein
MVAPRDPNDQRCERLVERTLAGDARAQRELIGHLWPAWLAQAGSSRSLGSLRRSEDSVRDIATRVAEKIGKPNGALRLYPHWREQHPEKSFGDWMRIVTSNVIRDYVREQLGSARLDEGEVSPKRLLNEFSSATTLDTAGVRPPYTAQETARQLLEYAERRLPPLQTTALALWLEGATFDEMSQSLGTDAAQARDLLRAAVAVLRRNFGNAK